MIIKDAVTNNAPLFILAYRAGSASAKNLAKYLSGVAKCPVRARDAVRAENSMCISWGMHEVPTAGKLFNHPYFVRQACEKSTTLSVLSNAGVLVPTWSTKAADAASWLADDQRVVARHVLTGHSGRGIQIVHKDEVVYRDPNMPDTTPWYGARLFTQYFKKTDEYRVFCVQGKVVLVYRKGLSRDVDENSRQFFVRTHATGWNFCSVELSDVPEAVLQESIKAQEALSLDFCAVDVGWHAHSSQVRVFEVNTAPGLEGSSIAVIGDALLGMDSEYSSTIARTRPAPSITTTAPLEVALDLHRRMIRPTILFGASPVR